MPVFECKAMIFLRGSFRPQIGLRRRRPAARRERCPPTAPKLHRVSSLRWKAKHPKASPSNMGRRLTQPLTHQRKGQATRSILRMRTEPALPGAQPRAEDHGRAVSLQRVRVSQSHSDPAYASGLSSHLTNT